MKNLTLFIAVLLITACNPEPKAGDDTKEMKALKTALSKYTQATIDNDINSLVSFVYPKVFTIISKEKMITMLTKTFKSGKVPKVENIKHTKIEKIKKYDKGIYSIINSSMTTIIKSPRPENSEVESYLLKTLQAKLASKGTVTLDKERHLFNIQHSNKTIAINETGEWKFVGFKQAKKYINKGIFPLMLIEKLD